MPTESGVDYVSAPADLDALFRRYYKFVVSLVRRSGISPANSEDVASEILLRFIERDFLNKFDPTLVFTYEGKDRPARFKQFLAKFVLNYVRGLRDRERNIAHRELLICDARVGEDQEDSWVELYAGSPKGHGGMVDGFEEFLIGTIDEERMVVAIRAHLETVPRRSRADACPLPLVWDAVVEQVRATGELNVSSLHARFDVSVAAMHSWTWWLKQNVAKFLARPLPAKRQQRRRTLAGDPGEACVSEEETP